jgi:quinol monooxygenase YgiN
MLILHVSVHVKPEFVDEFRRASIENASHSIQEPGIARFDVLQNADDPTRFLLIEAYRTEQAPAQHKQTPHYTAWNEKVAAMMAEPRTRVSYSNVFPADGSW